MIKKEMNEFNVEFEEINRKIENIINVILWLNIVRQ